MTAPQPATLPALVLVAAVADNGVIGQGGGLPWRLKSDLRNFRAVTMGKPVVMGRKTYLSIGKPLAGRTNIVVSRNRDFAAPGVIVVHLRPAGDTMFPIIDPALWREATRSVHSPGPDDAAGFTVLVYERHATHFGADNGGS